MKNARIRLSKYIVPVGVLSILFFISSFIVIKFASESIKGTVLRDFLVNIMGIADVVAFLITSILIIVASFSTLIKSFTIDKETLIWKITSISLSLLLVAFGAVAVALYGVFAYDAIYAGMVKNSFNSAWFSSMTGFFLGHIVENQNIYFVTSFAFTMCWFIIAIIQACLGKSLSEIVRKPKVEQLQTNSNQHQNLSNQLNTQQEAVVVVQEQQINNQELSQQIEQVKPIITDEQKPFEDNMIISKSSEDDWLSELGKNSASSSQPLVETSSTKQSEDAKKDDVYSIFD